MFDCGDTSLGHPHTSGHANLCLTLALPDLGELVSPDLGEQSFSADSHFGLFFRCEAELTAQVLPGNGVAVTHSCTSLRGFFEICLVRLLSRWDGFGIPVLPAAGLVAADKKDRPTGRIESEQQPDFSVASGARAQFLQVGQCRPVHGVHRRSPKTGSFISKDVYGLRNLSERGTISAASSCSQLRTGSTTMIAQVTCSRLPLCLWGVPHNVL